MDSKIVSKEIRERVRPLLRANGFGQFTGRTAWRNRGETIDVVNFQSFNDYHASVMDVTTYSFAVNLGSFPVYVPTQWPAKVRDGRLAPAEYECPFRRQLVRTLPQPGNRHETVWLIDHEGRSLLWCIEDVVDQFAAAFTWFERLANKVETLRILTEDDEHLPSLWGFGRNPSPMRSYLAGYVALSLGQNDLARAKLQEAVDSGCFTDAFGDVEEAIRRADDVRGLQA